MKNPETFTKTVKKIGDVRSYFNKFKKISEAKFFVVFGDQTKSMFPAKVFNCFKEGDTIEFKGHSSGEWINVSQTDFDVKITGTTTTIAGQVSGTNSSTVSSTTITKVPETEQIKVQVEYITKPRPNSRGEEYVMAKQLKDQLVENLYIPAKAIPESLINDVYSGYGILTVEGNYGENKSIFFTRKVLAFEPTVKLISKEVQLKDVSFRLSYISFYTPDNVCVTIPQDQVPFPFSPVFNSIKENFVGSIKVIGTFRKVGSFKRDVNRQWKEEVSWNDNGSMQFDFSNIDTDSIKKLEMKYTKDLEYAKILATLKASTRTFRSFSSIRTMFTSKGLAISIKEIESMYWDEKYDREFYNTLKRKADEIFVSDEEFVFVMNVEGRQFRIVERPTLNSATYLFDSTCDMDLLLQRLSQTKRWDLITDIHTSDGQSLRKVLGYKGRVIHQQYNEWLSKIEKTIGDGVELELIDKFIW